MVFLFPMCHTVLYCSNNCGTKVLQVGCHDNTCWKHIENRSIGDVKCMHCIKSEADMGRKLAIYTGCQNVGIPTEIFVDIYTKFIFLQSRASRYCWLCYECGLPVNANNRASEEQRSKRIEKLNLELKHQYLREESHEPWYTHRITFQTPGGPIFCEDCISK